MLAVLSPWFLCREIRLRHLSPLFCMCSLCWIGLPENLSWLRLPKLRQRQSKASSVAITAGTAARTPQDHGKATLAPMLSRELSPMDFTRPARELHNQVRGLIPWPAAVTELGDRRCKVFSTSVLDAHTDAAPGAILAAGKEGIQVACGGGTVLRIDELQADGGKRMRAADYLRGHPIPVG